MEQIDEAQRSVGQAAEHVERVAHVQADVGEVAVADVAERGGDAVDERLAADEAVVGEQIGAESEMLARAEADFEVERAVIAEQGARCDFAIRRHRDRSAANCRAAPVAPAAICGRSTGRRGG